MRVLDGAGVLTPAQLVQHTGTPVETPSAASGEGSEPPTKPPTGPGSPARRRRGVRTRRALKRPAVLRLTPEPAEQRIRAVLNDDPSASIKTIARRAHVGKSTASKWRAIIRSEGARQAAQ